MSNQATLNYAGSKPRETSFADAVIRNAIAYAWFQARGGLKSHLIMSALVAAGLAFLIGLSTSFGPPGDRSPVFTFWAMALLVLQSSTIVLVGGLGIVNAIRQDANSGMHESMRLMRISPTKVVLGYLTGASTQALNVFIPCSIAGAICSGLSGVGVGPWLWGALLLLSTAIFLLFIATFMGMMFKQGAVFVVIAAVFTPVLTGLLPVVPGLLILAGPAAGRGALAARNQDLSPIVAISIVCQAMLAALFFFSTAHRFRFPLLPAFGTRRGTLLLATWSFICILGLACWSSLYPRWMLGSRIDDFDSTQIIGSLIPAFFISLVPVLAACRNWTDWHRSVVLHARVSNSPALLPTLLAAAGLVVAPAFMALNQHNLGQFLPAMFVCLLATFAFHCTLSAVARRAQISLPKYAKVIVIALLVVLILFPLLTEWTLYLLSDEGPLLPTHTLSQFSPLGVYIAAWKDPAPFSLLAQPFIGTLAQVILAAGVSAALRLPQPNPTSGSDIASAPSPQA